MWLRWITHNAKPCEKQGSAAQPGRDLDLLWQIITAIITATLYIVRDPAKFRGLALASKAW